MNYDTYINNLKAFGESLDNESAISLLERCKRYSSTLRKIIILPKELSDQDCYEHGALNSKISEIVETANEGLYNDDKD